MIFKTIEANEQAVNDLVNYLLFAFEQYTRTHKLQNIDVAIAINYFHVAVLLSLEDIGELDENAKKAWREASINMFQRLMNEANDEN